MSCRTAFLPITLPITLELSGVVGTVVGTEWQFSAIFLRVIGRVIGAISIGAGLYEGCITGTPLKGGSVIPSSLSGFCSGFLLINLEHLIVFISRLLFLI